MEIRIYSSSPESIDPKEIMAAVEAAGYFVLSVEVVDGESI